MRRQAALVLALSGALGLALPGCQASRPGPYAEQSAKKRDTARAQELNQRAADLVHSDPERAERLLREALSHDLYFGPAHNNLGVIFLARGDLYEATGEFEWARRLMPGHPDPRLNLAIALERGGQIEEAILAYEAVLEIRPELDAAMVGSALLQLKYRMADHKTAELLQLISRASNDSTTREWALDQAAYLIVNKPSHAPHD